MRSTLVAVGLAAVLAATGCSGGGDGESSASSKPTQTSATPTPSPTESKIQTVANGCMRGHITQDDGKSITLDTKGPNEGLDKVHDDLDDVSCILTGLDTPDHVAQHINSTRALDGQQTDTWGNYEARWIYHPDDGLQITVIDRS